MKKLSVNENGKIMVKEAINPENEINKKLTELFGKRMSSGNYKKEGNENISTKKYSISPKDFGFFGPIIKKLDITITTIYNDKGTMAIILEYKWEHNDLGSNGKTIRYINRGNKWEIQ